MQDGSPEDEGGGVHSEEAREPRRWPIRLLVLAVGAALVVTVWGGALLLRAADTDEEPRGDRALIEKGERGPRDFLYLDRAAIQDSAAQLRYGATSSASSGGRLTRQFLRLTQALKQQNELHELDPTGDGARWRALKPGDVIKVRANLRVPQHASVWLAARGAPAGTDAGRRMGGIRKQAGRSPRMWLTLPTHLRRGPTLIFTMRATALRWANRRPLPLMVVAQIRERSGRYSDTESFYRWNSALRAGHSSGAITARQLRQLRAEIRMYRTGVPRGIMLRAVALYPARS
jgi:hypothetical protein